MGKLTKASAILIPFGVVLSIIGGVIMGMNEPPSGAIDEYTKTTYDVTEIAVTSIPGEMDEYYNESGLTFSSDEANSVVLNCTAANIYFYKNDGYYINSSSFFGSDFSVECKDGVINVNYIKEHMTAFAGEEIIIGIPRSCKSISINCNAGDINIDEFMGSSIDISIDCGNISINNSSASDYCKINNTLGNVYFYGSQISNLDAKLISGNLDVYDTILSGTNKANVDVGNAEFTLDGYPSDYSIKANVKVGEIECDYDLDDYTNSDNTIDISVLAGNCSIEYYDYD
ncbi:MAG: DUF4097 family beta strand repeat-containing protein [Oscillospiraceae bacterium]